MHKLLTKIFCALTLSLAFAGSVFAINYPAQSKDFYVNDIAKVIDEENEEYIIKTNVELRAKTGGQIVVMTVNNLEGESVEKYAYGVFNQYGIGDKDKDNGTLILLSVEDRKIRIETGTGTEGFINDGKAGRILDEFAIPSFREDNWNDGLRKTFDAVLGCYLQEYSIEIDGNTANYLSEEDDEISDAQAYLMVGAFFSTFITTPFISALCSGNKNKKTCWIIRGIIGALAVMTYVSTLDSVVKGTIFMMLAFNFLATFGIQLSGGYRSSGGRGSSSHSSGGYSGGGGSSRGGGASRSF